MIPKVEDHPLDPFLPQNAKLLMLGSFPPKKERWKMNFYYPNFQNDMWRIFGLCFFENKDYFLSSDKNTFDKDKLQTFLTHNGIAISDVAESVIRLNDNASDNFLEIVKARDIGALLEKIPECRTIVTTGKKATDTILQLYQIKEPQIGGFVEFKISNKQMKLYRMPSSSRAYPKPLIEKATVYHKMFLDLHMINK